MEIIFNKTNKKILMLIILILALICISKTTFAAERITISLNANKIEMYKGEKADLDPYVTGMKIADVKWSVSNIRVATVNGTGVIEARRAGTTTIRATAKDGSFAECRVTVLEKTKGTSNNIPSFPSEIKLNIQRKTIYKNKQSNKIEPINLKATLTSNWAKNKQISWSSSNTKIATVNRNGKVTFKSNVQGTVTITAETLNGKKATCTISILVNAQSIKFKEKEITLNVGDKYKLKVEKTPKEASISYRVEDEKIATLNANGEVTAIKAGETKIIVRTPNGKTATCKLIVKKVKEITNTVTEEKIKNLKKVDLSKKFGGWTLTTTHFDDETLCTPKTKKDFKFDNKNKWYTYNGKIVVACAMKNWGDKYEYRLDIYHFKKYQEFYIKLNGKWYEAIALDVCGVSMNPNSIKGNYYPHKAKTNHNKQVIDILTEYDKYGQSELDKTLNKDNVQVAIPK